MVCNIATVCCVNWALNKVSGPAQAVTSLNTALARTQSSNNALFLAHNIPDSFMHILLIAKKQGTAIWPGPRGQFGLKFVPPSDETSVDTKRHSGAAAGVPFIQHHPVCD